MDLAIRGMTSNFSLLPVADNKLIQGAKNYPGPKAHKKNSSVFIRKVIRFLRGEKNPLVDQIKKLAQDQGIIPDSKQKIQKVIEALKSIDYSSLKSDLKLILANMSDKERKDLLKSALSKDFGKEQKILGNKCINLMTLEQMRSLAKFVSPEFVDVQTTAKEFDEIVQTIKKYDVEEVRKKLINNSQEFILFRVIKNFVRTISVAFNLIELGKEPNTYYETKYMLDIYWRLLEIPLRIIKFIFSVIINPLISLAVIAIGTVVSSIALHAFKKWFKKSPEQLPYCKNLTAEIKNGTIKPIYGREKELDEIIEALKANNEMGRKHPLLIGKPGIGKTELMKGLAWRLANGKIPDVLKGKKLFYVNSAELKKNVSAFSLKDPLEQIMHKIDNQQKEMIVVFDEAHNLIETLGERFNSILDTSTSSLFYAIGITTRENYRNQIETTNLDRRFEKIPMEEASEEQTRTILRNMNRQQAPEIKVRKRVLSAIFEQTNEKIIKRCQPDKSIFVLSQALEKVRHLQNGGEYDGEIQALMAEKEDLASKLSRKKLHAVAVKSESITKLTGDLKAKDIKIAETMQKIANKKQSAEKYASLKKQRDWHEKWLNTTSKKIVEDLLKDKKISELLEKIYLFNNFILIPQLDKYRSNFVKEKNLEVEVTEEIITGIVDNLSEREEIKLQA